MGDLANKCSSCLELGHLNLMATQTVHGVQWTARASNCEPSVDENKECKCRVENRVLYRDSECHRSENSSFTHSVINMVGMLIGKLSLFFLSMLAKHLIFHPYFEHHFYSFYFYPSIVQQSHSSQRLVFPLKLKSFNKPSCEELI